MQFGTLAGQDPATRADIRGVLAAIDAIAERWSEPLSAMDERWEQPSKAMEQRLTATFERAPRDASKSQAGALLVSAVAIAGLTLGVVG